VASHAVKLHRYFALPKTVTLRSTATATTSAQDRLVAAIATCCGARRMRLVYQSFVASTTVFQSCVQNIHLHAATAVSMHVPFTLHNGKNALAVHLWFATIVPLPAVAAKSIYAKSAQPPATTLIALRLFAPIARLKLATGVLVNKLIFIDRQQNDSCFCKKPRLWASFGARQTKL